MGRLRLGDSVTLRPQAPTHPRATTNPETPILPDDPEAAYRAAVLDAYSTLERLYVTTASRYREASSEALIERWSALFAVLDRASNSLRRL